MINITKSMHKTTIILLTLIIILQTIIAINSANKREDYHIDEYYSHGLMQYKEPFILNNKDFYNNWHTKEYFEEYLKINSEDKFNFSAVYKNQIQDVHPPLYYLLLRIACSFNIGNFSKWPGIILNIIISAICTIILYLIGNKIFKNEYLALLLCLVNAMCIGTIEGITFIRMYELLTLNVLLLIYWHIINNNKQELKTKDLVLLGILIITGFLTHYYYAIIVAILYFMYVIKFIKQKNIQQLAKYTITITISVILSIIIFPYCINHIFFGYRGQEVMENMGNIDTYTKSIEEYLEHVTKHILNEKQDVIIPIIALLAVLAIIEKIRKKSQKQKKLDISCLYVIIPAVIYFIIISLGCKYKDFRYIIPIIPLVITTIIYIIQKLISTWANTKTVIIITSTLCILFSLTNIPKYNNNIYTYKDTAGEIDNIIKLSENKPIIVATTSAGISNNKFMETYAVVTKIKETYVLNLLDITRETIEKALKNKDTTNGVIVIVRWQHSEHIEKELLKTGLFSKCELIGLWSPYYYVFELH